MSVYLWRVEPEKLEHLELCAGAGSRPACCSAHSKLARDGGTVLTWYEFAQNIWPTPPVSAFLLLYVPILQSLLVYGLDQLSYLIFPIGWMLDQ